MRTTTAAITCFCQFVCVCSQLAVWLPLLENASKVYLGSCCLNASVGDRKQGLPWKLLFDCLCWRTQKWSTLEVAVWMPLLENAKKVYLGSCCLNASVGERKQGLPLKLLFECLCWRTQNRSTFKAWCELLVECLCWRTQKRSTFKAWCELLVECLCWRTQKRST